MTTVLLEQMGFTYIVAPEEADAQIAKLALDGIAITFDADLLALGATTVFRVDKWMGGKGRFVDVNNFKRRQEPDKTTTKEISKGLIEVYNKHGCAGFRYIAAIVGCDYTQFDSGIPGIGMKGACTALLAISNLNVGEVTHYIKNNLETFPQMQKSFKERVARSETFGNDFIAPVVTAYEEGLYYDSQRNIRMIGSDQIVKEATNETRQHSKGLLDPATGESFSEEDYNAIEAFKNMDLNTAMIHLDQEAIDRHKIPDNYKELNLSDLRGMISARQGKTSLDKEECLEVIGCLKKIEDEYDPMIVDTHDGVYLRNLTWDTTNIVPAREIAKLLQTAEIKSNPNICPILKFANDLYKKDMVITDLDMVADLSPEMHVGCVKDYFYSLGGKEQEKKKAVEDSYKRHQEQIETIDGPDRYHGYAIASPDIHLLVTAQMASMLKDEKSRKKTPDGEKPHSLLYMSIMRLKIDPATEDENGNPQPNGKFVKVIDSWCVCRAGAGLCVHKGMSLRDQCRLWAPNYLGEEETITDSASKWKHRGARKLRNFKLMRPLREMAIEKLDESKKDKKYRSCQEESNSVWYPVLTHEDEALFEEKCQPSLLYPLYDAIVEEIGGPCRAALTYQETAKDTACMDCRELVDLWGSKTQIKEWRQNKQQGR